MLTVDGARLQVFLELRRRYGLRTGPEELIILADRTIERPWGWVFFYTTRGWKDGDIRYAVGGNSPIMVNRFDGSFHDTGTAQTAEHYITAYEAELEREQKTWELVLLERPDSPLHVLSRIREALRLTVPEIGALRKRLPCVWKAGAFVDLEPIHARLLELGVAVELRRSEHSEPKIAE